MIMQIGWGSIVLVLCALLHVMVLIGGIRLLIWMGPRCADLRMEVRIAAFLCATIMVILLAHTLQVWIWGLSFILSDEIPDLASAIYFALVTYTTLGYGDLTLDVDMRLYAAMAAVTGLLTFGLSTAYLMAVFSSVLPASLRE